MKVGDLIHVKQVKGSFVMGKITEKLSCEIYRVLLFDAGITTLFNGKDLELAKGERMKTGDRVKIICDGATGTAIEIHTNHVMVELDTLKNRKMVFCPEELELIGAAPVVNPCIMCGAETPEGRIVCGKCEKSE